MSLGSITLDQLVGETVWLRRLAGSLVADQGDDAVHDTLLVASAHAPADRPLRPWLYRTLLNRVRVVTRSGSRRKKREEAAGELATAPARPDEIVERIELHRRLAGHVLELPQSERDIVLLHYFEGLTSIEIGNRLGISAGTVRWRLKQAVDELRARLDAESPNRAWLAPMLGLAKGSTATASVSSFVLAALAAIAVIVALLALAHPGSPAVAATSPASSEPAASEIARAPQASAPTQPAAAAVLDLDQQRIVGRVLDAQGRPVAGATVEVSCYMETENNPTRQTASDGSFSFEIDRGCEYDLAATTADGATWTNVWRHRGDAVIEMTLEPKPSGTIRVVDAKTGAPLPGASVSSLSNWVDRATTDSTGVAKVRWLTPLTLFRVRLSGYVATAVGAVGLVDRTLRLERGIEVSGVVFDLDAQPASRAEVHLIGPIDRDQWGTYGGSTDSAGGFVLALPQSGRYRIGAWAHGFGEAVYKEVDIGADGRTDLIAELVRAREITGTVVDVSGKPVSGARVRDTGSLGRPAVTDQHGRFTVRSPSGESVLIAQKGQDASLAQVVRLGAEPHAEIELRLGPAGVSGVVVDHDGTPIPHADVYLNSCCGGAGGPLVVPSSKTFTDDHGRFALDTPRGELLLSLRRDADDDFDDDDDVHVQGGARDVRLVLP